MPLLILGMQTLDTIVLVSTQQLEQIKLTFDGLALPDVTFEEWLSITYPGKTILVQEYI